jgi:hypothetical protein
VHGQAVLWQPDKGQRQHRRCALHHQSLAQRAAELKSCVRLTDPNVENCDGYHFGDGGCTAKCMVGYHQTSPEGTEHYTCDGDTDKDTGEWKESDDGGLVCAGNPCEQAPPGAPASPVPHALECKADVYSRPDQSAGQSATQCVPVASSTGCFGDPDDGSDGACDSPCQPGYNPDTRTPGYTCDTDGHWTKGSLTCTAKECDGHPYRHPTGTAARDGDPHINCDSPVTNNHGVFGDPCHASCTDGYKVTSGSASYTCKNVKDSDKGYWCVFDCFPVAPRQSCLTLFTAAQG